MKKDQKTKQDEQIDENLRLAFQSKVDEELPDRFTDLLAQLKKKPKKK